MPDRDTDIKLIRKEENGTGYRRSRVSQEARHWMSGQRCILESMWMSKGHIIMNAWFGHTPRKHVKGLRIEEINELFSLVIYTVLLIPLYILLRHR